MSLYGKILASVRVEGVVRDYSEDNGIYLSPRIMWVCEELIRFLIYEYDIALPSQQFAMIAITHVMHHLQLTCDAPYELAMARMLANSESAIAMTLPAA